MIFGLQKSPVTTSCPPRPLLLTTRSQNPELRRAAVCLGPASRRATLLQTCAEGWQGGRGECGGWGEREGVHRHLTSERLGACLRNTELSKKEAGSCPERTRGVPSADPCGAGTQAWFSGEASPGRRKHVSRASPDPAECPGSGLSVGTVKVPIRRPRALSAVLGLGREVRRKEHIHPLSELVPQYLITPK